jgi:hypothetical protein
VIGGWSYGGITTNYTIASDTRFKAAVSGAGSSLQLTMYGMDQYIVQYEQELGLPWTNPDAWMKVSYPFFHADRIKTPTLFMGGEKDFNVPIAGGEQMYQALKTQGLDTQLVIYPGQFHGLTMPSYERDRLQRYVDCGPTSTLGNRCHDGRDRAGESGRGREMTTRVNRQWRLVARPIGLFKPTDFEWHEVPAPDPGEGQVLVRTECLSLDPTNRGWASMDTYLPAVPLGEVMRGIAIGRVEASRNPAWPVGTRVQGLLGWQDYCLSDGSGLHRIPDVPADGWFGALGHIGLTAYCGLPTSASPKPARPWSSPRPPAPSVPWSARSARSRVAASSASPAAPTSAPGSPGNSASMRPSTTRPARSSLPSRPPALTASMSSSRTSAARFSTRRWR